MSLPLWAQPHHDGSPLYVTDPNPDLGDEVEVLLRVPRASGVRRALLRVVIDGEQGLRETSVDRQDERETWLRATVPMSNPVVNYRWLLDGVPRGYQWLNGEGVHQRDVTDASDFRLSTHPAPPDWAQDAILYQIFPDRFAKSVDRRAPEWAIPQRWDDPVIGSGPETPYQYFGGDLDGITAHLDHIAATGANTVYLTPIFPARSNHRYDAQTFDRIDPLLGGEAAFSRLTEAIHSRGMRLMGDLTANHSGSSHEWFTAARADANAEEAGYYSFSKHPDEYESWFGYPSLPKLNHESLSLRRRMYDGPTSVVAKWLGPHGFDGWRIDVANMTGRLGDVDLNHLVARTIQQTMRAADIESLLLAEHSHDASHDLDGDGWHGVMNYAGFSRPVWEWLTPDSTVEFQAGPFLGVPSFGGRSTATTMRSFAAAQPWRATAHALNLVGSHDTARIRTALESPALVTVAFGLLATMPGIPMLWAGDEIGMEGVNGEDGRRPFPWDDPSSWDLGRLSTTRELFFARTDNVALRRGGLRWLSIEDSSLTFLRESPEQVVLVHAARADHPPVRIPSDVLGTDLQGLAGTPDLFPDTSGMLTLPSHGPQIGVWSCERM